MKVDVKSAGAVIVATALFIGLVAWLIKVRAPYLLIAILICLFLLFVSKYLIRTTKVVLWLRKFNSGNDKFKPEKFFLAGKYCVFTLQDESYPFSPMDFLYNRPLLLVVGVSIGFPLLFVVVGSLFVAFLPSSVVGSFWFIGISAIAFAVFARQLGLVLAKNIHSTKVRLAEDISKIPVLAREVQSRGATPFPKVFACANTQWQDLVVSMIGIADAIFIDLSEVTEHMRWEISTTIMRRRGNKIVLLVETSKEPDWTRLKLARKLFGETAKPDLLERFQEVKIVRYKGHRDLSRDVMLGAARRKHRAISVALKAEIDGAING
jgi:hypothetical protein